jgi:hypothetical protein
MSKSILVFLEDIGAISAVSGPSLGVSNSMTSQAMPIAATDGTPDLNLRFTKKSKPTLHFVKTLYNKHQKTHH